MKKFIYISMLLVSLVAISSITKVVNAATTRDNGSNVKWTAVFENQVPRDASITQAYCDSHTPTVIVTDIRQITAKAGVTAINGVNIRYLSYNSKEIDGLHFNVVKGVLSGIDQSKKEWKQNIILYEQTLEEVGKTYTVWSTEYCKGTFIGYPTVVSN